MNRRTFLQRAGLATAASIGFPSLLPSGRLFAQTTDRMADHVVVVLFAGGVRQQESVLQRYLAGSQNETIEGNILSNLLVGAAPEDKIVYGTNTDRPGKEPIPKVLDRPLQLQGTLFREMQTSEVIHYNGLNLCVQGNISATQGLKQQPIFPTVFEYVRRHAGIPASKTWFIGSGIGNSIPLLSHSVNSSYGNQYAANFLSPLVTFGDKGFKYLSKTKSYHPEYELSPMEEMKFFLDASFNKSQAAVSGINNTEEEQHEISQFIQELFIKTEQRQVIQPFVRDNHDLRTVGYACEVLQRFTPTLTVIDLEQVDVCHGNFTNYLRNLHRADHAVGFLWNYIQTQIPEMSDNTVLLVVPECGRNLEANPIRDENDWFSYDHSDENSLRVFGMLAGPGVPQGLSLGQEGAPVGMTADIVPTVADVLGIKNEVMNQGYLIENARSLFDRI